MNHTKRMSKRDTPLENWGELFYRSVRFVFDEPQNSIRENYGHLVMERNTDPKTGKNKVYVFHDGEVVMEMGIIKSDGEKVRQSYAAPIDYRIVREEILNRREKKAVLEWKVQNGNN